MTLVCFFSAFGVIFRSYVSDEQTMMPEPSHFKLNTAGFILLLCQAGVETQQLKPVTTHQSCRDATWRAGEPGLLLHVSDNELQEWSSQEIKINN